jgi:hypothetical protein
MNKSGSTVMSSDPSRPWSERRGRSVEQVAARQPIDQVKSDGPPLQVDPLSHRR